MDMVLNMVMIKANVGDLKGRPSEYLARAARGERIVICRHNRPVAELRAIADVRTTPRPIGPLPDRPTFEIPPSFFEPLPADELERWYQAEPADPLSPGWAAPALRQPGLARERKTRADWSRRPFPARRKR
jgi:prevent-host-death family protein